MISLTNLLEVAMGLQMAAVNALPSSSFTSSSFTSSSTALTRPIQIVSDITANSNEQVIIAGASNNNDKAAHISFQLHVAPEDANLHNNFFVSKAAAASSSNNAPGTLIAPTSNVGSLVANIALGTPPQQFQVLIDTGSYEFWLQSSTCSTPSCMSNLKIYQGNAFNSLKSTTFSSTGPNLSAATTANQTIQYGDGSAVTCAIATDILQIGQISLPAQQVCLASDVAFISGARPLDGIIGLGPPGNPKVGMADVFGGLLGVSNKGLVAQASFWFDLADAYPYGTTTGQVTLGGVDNTKYTGSLLSLPIANSRTRWQVSLDFITPSTSSSPLFSSTTVDIMIDSGTTLVYLPTAATNAINTRFGASDVGGNGTWILPCSAVPTSMSTSFFLGGSSTPLTLSGAQAFIPLPTNPSTCQSIFRDSNQVDNLVVLGVLFMQNWYTVYDYAGASVAFGVTVQAVGQSAGLIGGGPARPAPVNSGLSTIDIVIIAAGGFLLLAIIAGAIIFYRSPKLRARVFPSSKKMAHPVEKPKTLLPVTNTTSQPPQMVEGEKRLSLWSEAGESDITQVNRPSFLHVPVLPLAVVPAQHLPARTSILAMPSIPVRAAANVGEGLAPIPAVQPVINVETHDSIPTTTEFRIPSPPAIAPPPSPAPIIESRQMDQVPQPMSSSLLSPPMMAENLNVRHSFNFKMDVHDTFQTLLRGYEEEEREKTLDRVAENLTLHILTAVEGGSEVEAMVESPVVESAFEEDYPTSTAMDGADLARSYSTILRSYQDDGGVLAPVVVTEDADALERSYSVLLKSYQDDNNKSL